MAVDDLVRASGRQCAACDAMAEIKCSPITCRACFSGIATLDAVEYNGRFD